MDPKRFILKDSPSEYIRSDTFVLYAPSFLLGFHVGGEAYKIVWPVLPVKRPDNTSGQAARLQAATFVWHSVKAKCSDAAVLGFRSAFAGNLVCANGRTVAEIATPLLGAAIPPRLTQQIDE